MIAVLLNAAAVLIVVSFDLANMENGSLPQSLAQFIFSNVTGGLTAPMGNGFSQGRRSGVQPPLSFAMPVGTAFSARGARDGRSFRVVTRDGASGATGIYAQAPNSHNVTHVNDVGGGSSAATSRGGFENFFPRNSFGTSLGGFVNNVEEEGDERNVIDFDPFIGEETDDDGEEEYYYNYVDVEQRVGNFDRVRNLSELRNPFLQRYRREGGDRQFSPRSFALNSHDRSAGVSAENALHIDDSDDDDVVEIVNMS